MVYYIKALANGLTKKVALPLAFAASALTPVMAGNTTLRIDFPKDGEKTQIALDETKTVNLMIQTKGDNVSYVDVNVELPAGIQLTDAVFEMANLPTLQNHQSKMERTPKGFHLMIYTDVMKDGKLATIGEFEEFESLGTFKVTANNALTGEDAMGLSIVDLTDYEANHIEYSNKGTNGEEGAEGDNSLASEKIAIDKTKFGGTFKVYTGAALNAEGQLEFNPLFDNRQNVQVKLQNEAAAKISGIEFEIILPAGLELDPASIKLDAERQTGQALSKQVITVEGAETNDYKVFVAGGDKAFNGNDGVLVSFDVFVPNDGKAYKEFAVDPATDFTDKITLDEIVLTDLNTVAVHAEKLDITVVNLNEKAYYEKNNAKAEVEKAFEEEINARVYDYYKVLNAREGVKKFLEEKHDAGTLGLEENKEAADELIGTYKEEIADAAKKNDDLYKKDLGIVEQLNQDLEDANKPQYSFDARGLKKVDAAEETVDEPVAEEPAVKHYNVEDYIDPALAEAADAAQKAIDAYEQKVQDLYDQYEEADPAENRWDGALLADDPEENPETAAGEAAALKQAAEKAIENFIAVRNKINDVNQKTFQDIANGELTDQLNAAIEYVKTLGDDFNTKADAYANETNFPEVAEAIKKATDAIADLLDEAGTINQEHESIALPYEEGIENVLNEFEKIIADIENIKKVADQAKKDNDDAADERVAHIWEVAEDPALLYGDFDGYDNLENQPKTYQDAYNNFEKALMEYYEALATEAWDGMVYKHADELDKYLEKFDKAAEDLKTVAENLTELNAIIPEVKDDLKDAKQKLEELRADEKYKYIDSSDKTAEEMKAIDAEVERIEKRIAELDDAINNAEDWTDLLNEEGEVDAWKEELNQLLADLEKLAGEDGTIDAAQAKYDFYHKRGDANMDGNITMLDYNLILQYVREELDINDVTPEELSQLNVVQEDYFVDEEGNPVIEVNITDATGALRIYLNAGNDPGDLGDRYYSARSAEADALTTTTTMVNGLRRIALNLNNAEEYTAAQMDVVLPEGMNIVNAQLGSRNSSHNLFVGSEKNGRQRIVISSSQLRTFEGNEGAVLYLDVEGQGEVSFNNVIFATTHAQSKLFNVDGAQTTGIASVKAAAEGEQVYSIGGRLMNAVKKGINIIRRADGTTQKVIK